MTAQLILQQIQDNKDKIEEYGIKNIGLFGSYITNVQSEDSDVDILVEFEQGKKTFDNYMDLKFFLEELFGCKVDLVIVEAIKPALKKQIMESVEYA